MALKLNKIIAAILFVSGLCISHKASAQDAEPYYDSTTAYTETAEEQTYTDNSYYYYSDSAQYYYNNKKLNPKFDRTFWENGPGKMGFEEDTIAKPKEKESKKETKDTAQKKSPPSISSSDYLDRFKYLLILIAIIIIGVIIYFMYKHRGVSNRKVNTDILIDFDDLDEQTLKEAALDDPLSQSLLKGDYKTAYRIKYLQVLQSLIGRNMILYRKEKTNYEYLMELSGKSVYEPFRMLTFNFDGIWYGELMIDREKYDSLQTHFDTFNYFMSHTS